MLLQLLLLLLLLLPQRKQLTIVLLSLLLELSLQLPDAASGRRKCCVAALLFGEKVARADGADAAHRRGRASSGGTRAGRERARTPREAPALRVERRALRRQE